MRYRFETAAATNILTLLFSPCWRARFLVLATLLGICPAAIGSGADTHSSAGASGIAPAGAAGSESTRFNKGLLWKIESPGHQASYLFGTIHSADPRVTELPPAVRSTFDRASSFTMEMLINGAGIASMAKAMFFENGQTLRAVVGEELYSQAREAMAQHGLPTQGLNKKKPWVVIMLLNTPRAEAGLGLDMLLQIEATLQGKPTYGLETMEEQIAVFNGMTMEDQVALLKDTVKMRVELAHQFETVVQAYRARDLASLMALVQGHKRHSTPAYGTMLERLLSDRNKVMLERMRPRLDEGDAFVAVGAAHLPGLLQLLETAGYRLTVIY